MPRIPGRCRRHRSMTRRLAAGDSSMAAPSFFSKYTLDLSLIHILEIINGKLVDKITTYDEYLESDEMARKRFTFTLTESEEADD